FADGGGGVRGKPFLERDPRAELTFGVLVGHAPPQAQGHERGDGNGHGRLACFPLRGVNDLLGGRGRILPGLVDCFPTTGSTERVHEERPVDVRGGEGSTHHVRDAGGGTT